LFFSLKNNYLTCINVLWPYNKEVLNFRNPFPRTNGLHTLSKTTIEWSVRFYSFLHFDLSNRSVLLMAPKVMVFSLMVVAANSHVSFLWSVLIFFHPFRGQLMVVPSNLRMSSLSQLRRAGGTRVIQSNSKILRAFRWIVRMFPTSGFFQRWLFEVCVTGGKCLSWFRLVD
jgi:hypothetical protein